MDSLQSSLFEIFEQSRPEHLILTISDSGSQDFPVAVHSNPGDHQKSFGDVPWSLSHFVVRSIHKEIGNILFNRPLKECMDLFIEIFCYPGY